MIELQSHHVFEAELLTFFDSVSDDFLESEGPSSSELMDAVVIFIVIRGELIVAHGDVSLFRVNDYRLFSSRNSSSYIELVRITVFDE